jgi:hypothetical protein
MLLYFREIFLISGSYLGDSLILQDKLLHRWEIIPGFPNLGQITLFRVRVLNLADILAPERFGLSSVPQADPVNYQSRLADRLSWRKLRILRVLNLFGLSSAPQLKLVGLEAVEPLDEPGSWVICGR